MQSVTEIQLNKLRAHFRARFAPMIWANCAPLNVWGGGDYYIGANQAGKRARSLFNCISVTDGIKINEQNKSIGIGPLYSCSSRDCLIANGRYGNHTLSSSMSKEECHSF